ncbi:MAG: PD-(D/E)XK nuclease family protein [Methanosarcinales archaeon Met12]|nr:MAG: PD-(D/E)XK nuclease family protein [Methanosarcinales archaeon Met12]
MTVYSHSRLSTYENCPLQYKHNHIDKIRLEPEITGIEAFMGIRVHEALEKLYRDLNVSKENNSHKGFRSGSAAKNT